MSTVFAERPRFFEGQFLGADDLDAFLRYAREQDARHMLGAHTWGIVTGIELVGDKPVSALVGPSSSTGTTLGDLARGSSDQDSAPTAPSAPRSAGRSAWGSCARRER